MEGLGPFTGGAAPAFSSGSGGLGAASGRFGRLDLGLGIGEVVLKRPFRPVDLVKTRIPLGNFAFEALDFVFGFT